MEQGANEVNPFMASLLSMGTAVFACVKYGIAVAALVILLIHKNYVIFHPLLRVKWLLVFLLFTHATLIGYEIMLLAGYSR